MNRSNMYFRVKDNSMCGDRINTGDLAVIDAERNENKDDLVLVDTGSQLMIRRVRTNGNNFVLSPSNPDFKEITCDDIDVLGVVVKILVFY